MCNRLRLLRGHGVLPLFRTIFAHHAAEADHERHVLVARDRARLDDEAALDRALAARELLAAALAARLLEDAAVHHALDAEAVVDDLAGDAVREVDVARAAHVAAAGGLAVHLVDGRHLAAAEDHGAVALQTRRVVDM